MTAFGPGTVEFTFGEGGTATNYECEVTGGSVGHAYGEREVKSTLCDTVARPPVPVREADSLKLALVNDLTATGLYAQLHTHDLEQARVVFTPSTAGGASWAGTVVCKLPEEIGADEWGEDIASEVELPGAMVFVFTPAPDALVLDTAAGELDRIGA